MRRVVLDTNAYSLFTEEGPDGALFEVLKKSYRIYVPVIVLGELQAGFRLGSQEQSNLKALAQFLKRTPVRFLHTTDKTVDHYATIYAQLQLAGTPIPTSDIWIAAFTMEAGAGLVTFDKHFQAIPGLQLVSV